MSIRTILIASLLALAPTLGHAAEEAPENPFAPLAGELKLGRTLRLRGAIVVSVHLDTKAQVELDAKVGLAGAKTEIMALPGPAGVWHVRIANQTKRPLLIPTGETLLTPHQASRCVDRAVWIAPDAATFVPVVQAVQDVPQGPYVSRGRGLTPFEQSMIPADRWGNRVRARNLRFNVIGRQEDDAAHLYTMDAFKVAAQPDRQQLDLLVSPKSVVGVFVADDRGPFFAHIQTHRDRFMQHWPFLRDGILLDSTMLTSVNGAPRPGDEGELRRILVDLLKPLADKPLSRPNFGEGWEYRWPLSDPTGHWDGLAIPGGPVSLRLYRYPERPSGSPPPPGTGPGVPEVPNPGIFELERRGATSEYEERLRERRRELLERNNGGAPTPGTRPPIRPPVR